MTPDKTYRQGEMVASHSSMKRDLNSKDHSTAAYHLTVGLIHEAKR